MNKKEMINQLSNQKGISASDVLIALLIILTSLGVIAMVYANLTITSRGVDRKTGATRIATNLLENMQTTFYDKIETTLENLVKEGLVTKQNETYTITGSQEPTSVFSTKIPNGYTVKIALQNPENALGDFVKKVTVEVSYKVNEQLQTATLSKVIEKEEVKECNVPDFSEQYIQQLGVTKDNFYMSYDSNVGASFKETIICPIKYTGQNYKIITDKTEMEKPWYSYSNKQWARVLLLDTSELNQCLQDSSKISEKLKLANKSYVWIPRFGVQDGGNLFGDTYFRYRDTNFAILNSYGNNNQNLLHNYLDLENSILWSIANGTSFDRPDNKQLGNWLSYLDITITNTDAEKLNHSQYGPLMEY